MFYDWLSSTLANLRKDQPRMTTANARVGTSRSSGVRRKRRTHYGLRSIAGAETLEPRIALSAVTWTGAGDGQLWSDPNNWNRDGVAQVPQDLDDVTIPNVGDPLVSGDVTIAFASGTTSLNSLTSAESLDLSGGSLQIAAPSQIDGSLTLDNATLTANADLSIQSRFDWIGGTLNGGGATVIETGAVMDIHGEANTHNSAGHTIRGAGLIDWSEGTVIITSGNTLTILADLNITGPAIKTLDGSLQLGSTTTWSGGGDILLRSYRAVLTNQIGAVLNVQDDAYLGKAFGGGLPEFRNEGTLNIQAETLVIGASVLSSWGADSATTGPGFVQIDGHVSINGAGATVDHVRLANSGELTVNHDLMIAGTFDWTGGTLGGAGATVLDTGAVMHISGDPNITHGARNHTIRGDGLVDWSSGSLNVVSGDTLTVLADVNITGPDYKNLFGRLNLGATTTWSGGGDLYLYYSTAVVTNQAGAVFVVLDDTTIRKSVAGVPEFRNEGTLEVQAATFALGTDVRSTWSADSTITGPGFVHIDGHVAVTGPGATVDHVRLANGGTLTVNHDLMIAETFDWIGGTLTGDGDTMIAAGAVMNIDGGGTLNVNGGNHTIRGAGRVDWHSGTMQTTTNTLTVLAHLNLDGSRNRTLLGTLALGGTTTWSGEGDLYLWQTGTILHNLAGADFIVSGDARLGRIVAGTPEFRNEGTLQKLNGGTMTIDTLVTFNNTGTVEVFSGALDVTGSAPIQFDEPNYFLSRLGGTLVVGGNFSGTTRNAQQFAAQGQLRLAGAGSFTSPQLFEVMSQDRGAVATGYLGNFAHGVLEINTSYVQLTDTSDNAATHSPEALYVDALIVDANSTLDLNGMHVYARTAQIEGPIVGGIVNILGAGGEIVRETPTTARLQNQGQVDEWTFFGRRDENMIIVADPAQPLAPYLGQLRVEILDPNGQLLAAGESAATGVAVSLDNVSLPEDGVYRLRVSAAPAQPAATGNYVVTVGAATLDVRRLVLNQRELGNLGGLYGREQWTFSASSGQSVRLDVLNSAVAGLRFKLTGPADWSGFADQTTDSEPVTLPLSGQYILEADSNGIDTGGYAFQLNGLNVIPLHLGNYHTGTIVGSGDALLFHIQITETHPLVLALDHSVDTDNIEVYIRPGLPATRREFYVRHNDTGASHLLHVPLASPGSWFVLVYGQSVGSPSEFTIRAESAPLSLTGVTPDRVATNQTATLRLSGVGFLPGSQVALVAPDGTTYPAQSVGVDTFEQATAEFDLTGVPEGTYDLSVSRSDGVSQTLSDSVHVLAPGEPHLETRLVLPAQIRRNGTATIHVEYANTGASSMRAPVLTLQSGDPDGSDRPLLTLDGSKVLSGFWTSGAPDGFSTSVHIYGTGEVAGVLLPGERVRVPVYYVGLQQPWDLSDAEQEFEILIREAGDPTPVDWSSLQSSLQPSWMTEDAWGAVYANLVSHIGPTWGDYVNMLSENATYLGRLGLRVTDVAELYNFEVQQARGRSIVSTLASSVDAAIPAPGVQLEYDRTSGNTITERYRRGPFGYGWTAPWQVSLELASDGTAIVHESADVQRRFQPDSRAAGQFFSKAGDYGTLRQLSSGVFELTEENGLVTRFHTDGKLDYVEDLNANRITAGHTADRLTSLTHSSGVFLTIGYNGANLIDNIRDSSGRTTTYAYDGSNTHLLTVTSEQGTTTYTYSVGNGATREHALLSVASPTAPTHYFEYDDRGRLAASQWEGGWERVEYAYDNAGRVATTDATGVTAHHYFDHRGLVVRTENGVGDYTRFEFDSARQLVRQWDALGRSTSFTGSPATAEQTARDTYGNVTTLVGGGPQGQPLKFIDAVGNTVRYSYDAAGHLTSGRYPDSSIEQIAYDERGNPISLVNRRGQEISQSYNSAGQVTEQVLPNGSMVSYTYDAEHRMASATDSGGTTAFSYNAMGHLIRIDYPNGRWLAYNIDAAGHRTRMEDHSGFVVQFDYDAAGRLSALRDGADAQLMTYSYDAAGRLSREDKGNGTYTLYTYDDAGRTESIVHLAVGDVINSQFLYSYDVLGQQTGLSTLDGDWTYEYDLNGQLAHAMFISSNTTIPDQDLNYEYDAMGNRVGVVKNGESFAHVANAMNQYTVSGDTRFQYDLDGNLIGEIGPQGNRAYSYNELNQLVEVTSPEGSWQYEYDVFGHRTALIDNGVRTEFLLDPTGLGSVIGEYDDAGVRTISYAHGLGLELASGVTGVNYYDFSSIGSTAGLSDSTGAYVNEYAYDPFGETLRRTESVANSFEFVGEWGVQSEDSGLSFMRARYYDPKLGRFVAQDPLRLGGGDVNLYRYVGNNSVQNSDPSGLSFAGSLGCWLRNNTEVGIRLGTYFEGTDGGSKCDLENPKDKDHKDPDPDGKKGDQGSSASVGGIDPNEKLGAAGVGSQAFIRAEASIPYRIHFENLGPGSEPTPDEPATAPAQRVEVTDQLSGQLDWTTLEFTEVGFGDYRIDVPAGRQHYFEAVSMSFHGETFNVEVELSFDADTGQMSAVFQSVNPETSLPPSALAGFLPPEDATGRGKGYVSFTVKAADHLPSGAELRNVALIRFDGQNVIATNQIDPQDPSQGTDSAKEALNTIDADNPDSRMDALPTQSIGSLVRLSWSGNDGAGSGVVSYDIYASKDGGDFALWRTLMEPSALFSGIPFATYAFYSRSRDAVGYLEEAPVGADATTTIVPYGDFDNNGLYNGADIDALVADIAAGTNDRSFDGTYDGIVDSNDLALWLADAGHANLGSGIAYLVGDISLDGVVDISDFNIWNSNKFTNVARWTRGDINADGAVDISDFNIWNGNKFRSSAAPTSHSSDQPPVTFVTATVAETMRSPSWSVELPPQLLTHAGGDRAS